jgi:hypothetical protein
MIILDRFGSSLMISANLKMSRVPPCPWATFKAAASTSPQRKPISFFSSISLVARVCYYLIYLYSLMRLRLVPPQSLGSCVVLRESDSPRPHKRLLIQWLRRLPCESLTRLFPLVQEKGRRATGGTQIAWGCVR